MKTPKSKSRVVGVRVGEVRFDFLRAVEEPLVEVHFALIRDDLSLCGRYTKSLGWSPKVSAALEALRSALEEDAALELFEPEPATTPEETSQI